MYIYILKINCKTTSDSVTSYIKQRTSSEKFHGKTKMQANTYDFLC